jgi:hypothetical protein
LAGGRRLWQNATGCPTRRQQRCPDRRRLTPRSGSRPVEPATWRVAGSLPFRIVRFWDAGSHIWARTTRAVTVVPS